MGDGDEEDTLTAMPCAGLRSRPILWPRKHTAHGMVLCAWNSGQ